jgi:hypothetical protein
MMFFIPPPKECISRRQAKSREDSALTGFGTRLELRGPSSDRECENSRTKREREAELKSSELR